MREIAVAGQEDQAGAGGKDHVGVVAIIAGFACDIDENKVPGAFPQPLFKLRHSGDLHVARQKSGDDLPRIEGNQIFLFGNQQSQLSFGHVIDSPLEGIKPIGGVAVI